MKNDIINDKYIAKRLKEISGGRYFYVKDFKNHEFREIQSDENWTKIKFHFEFGWGGNKEIHEVKKVNLKVHLHSKEKNIRDFFEMESDNVDILPKTDFPVAVDFSDKEKTDMSLMDLVKVFDSDEYQKWAQRAEEYLSLLDAPSNKN